MFDFSNAINSFTQATKLLPDEKIRQELVAAEKARDANNYEILQVEMTASEKQLKVAYRKACLKWHPDKHNNGEDAQYRANCMFKVKLRIWIASLFDKTSKCANECAIE